MESPEFKSNLPKANSNWNYRAAKWLFILQCFGVFFARAFLYIALLLGIQNITHLQTMCNLHTTSGNMHWSKMSREKGESNSPIL